MRRELVRTLCFCRFGRALHCMRLVARAGKSKKTEHKTQNCNYQKVTALSRLRKFNNKRKAAKTQQKKARHQFPAFIIKHVPSNSLSLTQIVREDPTLQKKLQPTKTTTCWTTGQHCQHVLLLLLSFVLLPFLPALAGLCRLCLCVWGQRQRGRQRQPLNLRSVPPTQ